LQRMGGGNAMFGRQRYPLLSAAGFDAVRVSPRMVYVDSSRPDLVDGFTRKTFTAMVEGVRGRGRFTGLLPSVPCDDPRFRLLCVATSCRRGAVPTARPR
jgi:hypothetical protein